MIFFTEDFFALHFTEKLKDEKSTHSCLLQPHEGNHGIPTVQCLTIRSRFVRVASISISIIGQNLPQNIVMGEDML